jgi:hypothetical protein
LFEIIIWYLVHKTLNMTFPTHPNLIKGMGFSLEQSQEALFRAVRNGVAPGNMLEASIEMLIEGQLDVSDLLLFTLRHLGCFG